MAQKSAAQSTARFDDALNNKANNGVRFMPSKSLAKLLALFKIALNCTNHYNIKFSATQKIQIKNAEIEKNASAIIRQILNTFEIVGLSGFEFI